MFWNFSTTSFSKDTPEENDIPNSTKIADDFYSQLTESRIHLIIKHLIQYSCSLKRLYKISV
jgi:hypothetical protein